MPRYTLRSVEVADELYARLPEATRRLVDRRITELLERPTSNPHAEYDKQFDQWSTPIGDDKGFILYAIQQDARQVILLRFLPGLK
jgi:hypothetical protein